MEVPCVVIGVWLAPPPSPRRAHQGRYDTTKNEEWGPQLATSGDFFMATDMRRTPQRRFAQIDTLP